MRPDVRVFLVPLLILALPLAATPAAGQAHAHMGHVMEGFQGTPEGMGLLPTAVAEAEVAAQHASFAAQDLGDLSNMKRHTVHVLHALDPETVESGPGKGYGVKQAAAAVAQHIQAAAASDDASENVKTHATHVATSAENTVERAEKIVELGREIQAAESADEAAPKVEEMNELAQALISGEDQDGDGRVSWREGEGGLQQARQHMGFMMEGEGMSGR